MWWIASCKLDGEHEVPYFYFAWHSAFGLGCQELKLRVIAARASCSFIKQQNVRAIDISVALQTDPFNQ
jgi:hypothetical protein